MVFDCFGCVALGVKQNFVQYLDSVMKMYDLAFSGAIQLTLDPNSKAEDLDYSEALRDKLVESLTCLCHAFS